MSSSSQTGGQRDRGWPKVNDPLSCTNKVGCALKVMALRKRDHRSAHRRSTHPRRESRNLSPPFSPLSRMLLCRLPFFIRDCCSLANVDTYSTCSHSPLLSFLLLFTFPLVYGKKETWTIGRKAALFYFPSKSVHK